MRTGSTIAEVLVVVCILGLGLCMFAPTSEEAAGYTLDIIIAVVAVGAVVVACVSAGAFWRRPLLVAGATMLCTAGGAAVGWVAIMHSLLFVVCLGLLCVAFIVYLIIVSGRRAEQ